jgi:hypothetical protein
VDRRDAVLAKTEFLQRMTVHGRRALTVLSELDQADPEPEVLTRLAGELDAQADLLDECRRLDGLLPAGADQWADWLAIQPAESRRPAQEALDALTRMTDEAARVEAEVGQRLGRLRDEVSGKLERVRAGHRIVKAYLQPRPNVPKLVDRQG